MLFLFPMKKGINSIKLLSTDKTELSFFLLKCLLFRTFLNKSMHLNFT
jgi:hypothetical protein